MRSLLVLAGRFPMIDWVGLRPRAIDFPFSREPFLKARRDTEKRPQNQGKQGCNDDQE